MQLARPLPRCVAEQKKRLPRLAEWVLEVRSREFQVLDAQIERGVAVFRGSTRDDELE